MNTIRYVNFRLNWNMLFKPQISDTVNQSNLKADDI